MKFYYKLFYLIVFRKVKKEFVIYVKNFFFNYENFFIIINIMDI